MSSPPPSDRRVSYNSPPNQKAELENPMSLMPQQARRALWLVLVLVFIGLLIVGCTRSSSVAPASQDEELKWDQGQWDAVKWG